MSKPMSFKPIRIESTHLPHSKKFEKLDHLNSEHAMGIQKSKYIMIEDDIHKLAEYANIAAGF